MDFNQDQSFDRPSAGRSEDRRFITGTGQYTGDALPDNVLYAEFYRAPIARGRLVRLDCGAARTHVGVHAILTADDAAADGLAFMPWTGTPKRDDGGVPIQSQKPVLSGGLIRHLGEPVAMVIAESKQAACDAVEMIIAEFSGDRRAAIATDLVLDSPLVWDSGTDNIAAMHIVGDKAAVDAALGEAAHVAILKFDISRMLACPMEMRNSLCYVDNAGRICLRTSSQSPFALRSELASYFGVTTADVHVTTPDVGGSFGMKGGLFREDAALAWAARRLGQSVYWAASRSESFLSDDHARGVCGTARLGLDGDGNFIALDVDLNVDVGDYLSRRSMGMLNNLGGIAGQYRTPHIAAQLKFIHTNTVSTAPYRGFGRPEATYIIERLTEKAARETSRDKMALRLQNLITPDMMPYKTGLTFNYDCGDFPKVMTAALAMADYDGFAKRRADAAARGLLRGIGAANPIEVAGGPLRQVKKDMARITARVDGSIVIDPGLMSVGQGHETALTRMAQDRLQIAASQIVYRHGDTDLLASGRGNGGSAATVVAGAAVSLGLDQLLTEATALAAEIMQSPVSYANGYFSARSSGSQDAGQTMSWAELVSHSNQLDGLRVDSEFLPDAPTYPNGCHICEVEIDPKTGLVTIVDYVGVEDVGTVLNRDLVEGQMQGGIVQGIGQALGEILHYDVSGQLLTGSFMDYQMPIAADIPPIRLATVAVPTKINPLGAKGVGEAGTVGALAAVMNAVEDALASAGVTHFEMPANPYRVWNALQLANNRLVIGG